jgi:glycosyltransferase involved in cell wall biosynthesis
LGPWIDYASLEAIALARPNWSLVLAGPKCSAAASRLISLPNVHHLGTVDYDKLPSLAAHYDVALAPFTLNELTRCVHPIKALEYLALGLPTVASRLPSLLEMNAVIQFAATPAEWIDAVSAALCPAAREPGIVAARREVARGQSWEHRIRQIEAHLAATLRAAERNRARDRRPARRLAA